MKYSRRYIVFAIIILLLGAFQWQTISDEQATVDAFRGAHLSDDVFLPLISGNVNAAGSLSLTVDGETFVRRSEGLYVDNDMTVMAELPFVRDIFRCSARGYEESDVILERGSDTYAFPVGKTNATKNGGEIQVSHSATFVGGQYYLPLRDLCEFFGYNYKWNKTTDAVTLSSENAESATLPSSFDLRERNRAAAIKDQGSSSTCWAYAAIGALESSCLPEDPANFSAEDLIANNTYGRDASAGGDYRIAASYFLSWTGPVTDGAVQKHVQEVHFFENEEIEELKWAVFMDGGVSSPLYIDAPSSSMRASSFYNESKNAYYYAGDAAPNHDIVIIGWDDNFPAANFTNRPSGDGAFLCQNSWGVNFGDDGVFYVSYYDTNIGEMAVSYVGVENTDRYDNIYQSDLLGQVGAVGYGRDTIYAANVYHAANDETVTAVGFYTLSKNTRFRVAVVSSFNNELDLIDVTEQASGVADARGFYTVRLDEGVPVRAGDDFAVWLFLESPGSERPLGVEYETENVRENVDLSDGRGYISLNGADWESIEETQNANICLKAYTVW